MAKLTTWIIEAELAERAELLMNSMVAALRQFVQCEAGANRCISQRKDRLLPRRDWIAYNFYSSESKLRQELPAKV